MRKIFLREGNRGKAFVLSSRVSFVFSCCCCCCFFSSFMCPFFPRTSPHQWHKRVWWYMGNGKKFCLISSSIYFTRSGEVILQEEVENNIKSAFRNERETENMLTGSRERGIVFPICYVHAHVRAQTYIYAYRGNLLLPSFHVWINRPNKLTLIYD